MAKSVSEDRLDRPVLEFLRRDFVALRSDLTVQEALAALRSQQLSERVVYLYVVDPGGKLVGVVPTRTLLTGALEARLESVMQPHVVTLPASATLLLACELFVMHRLLAFPVVDEEGRLLGLVDVSLFTDEMFDLSERRAADDVFQLIGVRLALSGGTSTWASFKRRFPWLLCNVLGGIACALLVGQYEAFLDTVIVLAVFIPVVLAVAESVSMQSMTLTLQALHQRHVDWRFFGHAVVSEFGTAGMLGLGSGTIVGLVALLWKHVPAVAIAIGGTILVSVVTACVLGVVLPAGVRALRGDPRIAAGPIVLAVADLATLLLYFNLAGLLLGRAQGA